MATYARKRRSRASDLVTFSNVPSALLWMDEGKLGERLHRYAVHLKGRCRIHRGLLAAREAAELTEERKPRLCLMGPKA